MEPKPGRNPKPLNAVPAYKSFAPPSPRAAPASVTTPASAMTSPNSVPSLNPMVLSTATSPVRSRAVIIIALAVTIRIANTTAIPIEFMRNCTFPHIVTKLWLNAFSVIVLVGAVELRNMSSTVWATLAACAGSESRNTNHPGVARCSVRSYR